MRWQVGVQMGLIEVGRSQPPRKRQIMFAAREQPCVGLTTGLVHTDVARPKRQSQRGASDVH